MDQRPNSPEGGIPSPIQPEGQQPQPDLTKLRDDMMIPLAKQVLKIIAAHDDLFFGVKDANPEEGAKYFSAMYENELLPILKERNLRIADLGYLFQLAMQPVENLRNITLEALQTAFDNATKKHWGVQYIDEVRINDVERALTDTKPVDN